MDLIELMRTINQFAKDNGIYETIVVLLIVSLVVRDWWKSRNEKAVISSNTDAIKALAANSQQMTKLFIVQVESNAKSAEAVVKSAAAAVTTANASEASNVLLATQNRKLDDIKAISSDQNVVLESLRKGQGEDRAWWTKFGSDPFKGVCQVDKVVEKVDHAEELALRALKHAHRNALYEQGLFPLLIDRLTAKYGAEEVGRIKAELEERVREINQKVEELGESKLPQTDFPSASAHLTSGDKEVIKQAITESAAAIKADLPDK